MLLTEFEEDLTVKRRTLAEPKDEIRISPPEAQSQVDQLELKMKNTESKLEDLLTNVPILIQSICTAILNHQSVQDLDWEANCNG